MGGPALDDTDGARTFAASGTSYDNFMGRYSRPLAARFADAADVAHGQTVLDAGCGPGALTAELVARVGAERVAAFDPSPSFVDECRARNPGVDVRIGRLETVPWPDAQVDVALAQLVLHFVSDPDRCTAELARVVRPGGTVGACVWDFAEGMQMLRLFWDAALALDAQAPDEARTLRFGRAGEIADLFASAGLRDIRESTLEVRCAYRDFDELWGGFLQGVGPAGDYCMSRTPAQRKRLREEVRRRVADTTPLTLTATARCAVARTR